MSEGIRNVVIIGSGPAGLTAAIYAGRANLKPLLVSGYEAGGQLMLTSEVENFPGFREAIMGPKLIEEMREQAVRSGAEYLLGQVESCDLAAHTKVLNIDGTEIKAHTVIIATGASANWLPIPAIKNFLDQGIGGVTTCAVCDGHFFKGGKVAVVGGGDSAMEEATYLSRMMEKVYLIHRRNEFRASKIMQDRVFGAKNIEVLWETGVTDIHDVTKKKVSGITIQNVKTGAASKVEVDALFMAIGHTPNTNPFKNQISMDPEGYIVPAAGTLVKTNQKGVFVAGDVADKNYRQAITAAGMGCMSAIDAERYLTEEGLT